MPSHGRAGLLTRPNLRRSSSTRIEQIDRHDHVDMLGAARALAFELQRADADQLAGIVEISPVPPQFGCDGWVKIASSSRYSRQLANSCFAATRLATDRVRPPAPPSTTLSPTSRCRRRADRQRINVEPAERLHQAEAGSEIEAECVALDRTAVAEMQPYRGRLGDQIADRHPPRTSPSSIMTPLPARSAAERLGAEGVGWNDRMQSGPRSSARARDRKR